MTESEPEAVPQTFPRLWNPAAAAWWSLLLSPMFGAYIHAANWRTLGNRTEARANLIWMLVTFLVLVVDIVLMFVPQFSDLNSVILLAQLGVLAGWYLSQAHWQIFYVNSPLHLRGHYVRKGWWSPLLIAGSLLVFSFLTSRVITDTYRHEDPVDVAAMVKDSILQEWKKDPDLRRASIQSVTLDHKGGKVYGGFVEATLDSVPGRMSIEVILDRRKITFTLKPISTE